MKAVDIWLGALLFGAWLYVIFHIAAITAWLDAFFANRNF